MQLEFWYEIALDQCMQINSNNTNIVVMAFFSFA
jgi:hypothetical protein